MQKHIAILCDFCCSDACASGNFSNGAGLSVFGSGGELVHCAKCEVEGRPKVAYKVPNHVQRKAGGSGWRDKHQRVRRREALEGAEKLLQWHVALSVSQGALLRSLLEVLGCRGKPSPSTVEQQGRRFALDASRHRAEFLHVSLALYGAENKFCLR